MDVIARYARWLHTKWPAGLVNCRRRSGLNFSVFEDARAFSTLANFPVGKPIYAYLTELDPAGSLRIRGTVKGAPLEELEEQRLAASIEPVCLRIDRVERRSGLLQVVPSDSGCPAPR